MIRLLLLFALLIGSTYLGLQLNHDPGYIFIEINHWTLETTLLVGLVGLFFLFSLFHVLLLLFNGLIQLPSCYHQWRARRRAHKAQTTTRQGLIEFSEGYWSLAKNHLIKALPDADTPLLNYLTAARAAQELGDNQLRDNYLREAQQSMPDAKIAVELTQAQLQLANKQWEQALATLRHLQDLAPHHPYVLKLLMQLYQEVKDWPQLLNLLPELKKYKVIVGDDFEQLSHYTHMKALSDLIRTAQTSALNDFINKLPRNLQYDPELMTLYSEYLISNEQFVLAESILRQCLRKTYHEKLIALYGKFFISNKQLSFAESFIKKNSNSPALYLCLGRLCIAEQLWGKAKTYLEKSILLEESPETYIEIGKLLEQLGEKNKACDAYRNGLMLSTKVI